MPSADQLELSQVFCIMHGDNGLWRVSQREGDTVWENINGGIHHFNLEERKLFQIQDWRYLEDIQVSLRILEFLDDNLDTGMISPEGCYYGVYAWESDGDCNNAFGFNRRELLDEGWIVIDRDRWLKLKGYKIMTDPQNEMLINLGRDINDQDKRDLSVTYDQTFPKGNRAAQEMRQYHQSKIDQFVSDRAIPSRFVRKLVA